MKPATLATWLLGDEEVENALNEAFRSLESHHASIRKLTFSGIEDGRPVLEVLSETQIPASVTVTGAEVSLRSVADPVGCVLYVRE